MFQRENYFVVPHPPPPPHAVRNSRISSALLLISSEFLLPLPPSPHTRYNVTVEDEKLENCLRYLLSDNPACVGRFLREEYKKPHDDSNNRAVKREANHILDKHHAITENITKQADSLFMEGGKLKSGPNCLHNFNNEKRHYIKSGVEKDVLHLVEDLYRLIAKYKATYQIGTKSTTSEARKGKEHRKKGGKRKLATCENRRKKHA